MYRKHEYSLGHRDGPGVDNDLPACTSRDKDKRLASSIHCGRGLGGSTSGKERVDNNVVGASADLEENLNDTSLLGDREGTASDGSGGTVKSSGARRRNDLIGGYNSSIARVYAPVVNSNIRRLRHSLVVVL